MEENKKINSTFPKKKKEFKQQINSGKVNNHIFCEQISILLSRYLVRPFLSFPIHNNKKIGPVAKKKCCTVTIFLAFFFLFEIHCVSSVTWIITTGCREREKEKKEREVSCSTQSEKEWRYFFMEKKSVCAGEWKTFTLSRTYKRLKMVRRLFSGSAAPLSDTLEEKEEEEKVFFCWDKPNVIIGRQTPDAPFHLELRMVACSVVI